MLPIGLLIATSIAFSNTVTIEGWVWAAYQAPEELRPEPTPSHQIVNRDVTIDVRDGELHLTSRWWIHATSPGWVNLRLADSSMRDVTAYLDGISVPLRAADASSDDVSGVHLTTRIERSGILELRGIVPESETFTTPLWLLGAAHGRIEVNAGKDDVTLRTASDTVLESKDVFWTAAERVHLIRQTAAAKPVPKRFAAKGRVAMGLTASDSEIRGKAKLEWRIAHGSLNEVTVSASNIGRDLRLTGPAVANWNRQGDQIRVSLREPISGKITLDLGWTTPFEAGDETTISIPRFELGRTLSTESTFQLAREGDMEALPDLPGWQAAATTDIPSWGRGLVTGTPSASYLGANAKLGGEIALVRFTPLAGPATIIDVAAYTIATTELGRNLTRAHLSVRNDRGSHLRVRPPPGAVLVGARVGQTLVTPVTDGSGDWLIPLSRSVETVEGLLSFPVELTLLGQDEGWNKLAHREQSLPTFDAPVAVSRVTLHLPPNFRNALSVGQENSVHHFDEGGHHLRLCVKRRQSRQSRRPLPRSRLRMESQRL